MKAELPVPAANLLRELTSLLVRGEYQELERRSKSVRIPATELKAAVEEYGRTLVEMCCGSGARTRRQFACRPGSHGSKPSDCHQAEVAFGATA